MNQAGLGDLDLWPFKSAWGRSSELCNYGAEFALERGQGLQLEEKPLDFSLLLFGDFFPFHRKKNQAVFVNAALLSGRKNIGI